MRDFLPADVRRREYVIGVIKEVYERYGFEPLETPAVENIETLMGKYGEEGNQLIFKILKRGVHESSGEADLALRYDLTVPLARVVAEYRDKLPRFFKRYQIQPVWRADRPARGRFREFYQCDVDVLGSKSPIVEAELCAAVSDILEGLGFIDFTIRLNHRELLDAMMSAAMIEKEKRSNVLVILDKLEKLGGDEVGRQLSLLEIPQNRIDTILHRMLGKDFLALDGKLEPHRFSEDNVEANREMLALLLRSFKDLSSQDEGKVAASEAIRTLQEIVDLSEGTSAAKHVKIDPSLARGLSYYTGAIMEITVKDLQGSLGGGGRYDHLIGMFLGQDVAACGFSLGLERIVLVMTERDMFPARLATSSADVLVASLGEDFLSEAISLATDLRSAGISVSVYPDATNKPQKPLSYADAQKIPLTILIGENEYKNGVVTVRNLVERTQERPVRQIAVDVAQAMLLSAKNTRELEHKRLQATLEYKDYLREDH